MSSYACPCCGYRTLEERGAYELCPVCYWEDDGDHDDDVLSRGGPNGMTLAEGQRRFARHGAVALHCLDRVRRPRESEARDPGWRPLQVQRVDDRTHFLEDFGALLDGQFEHARRRARVKRSRANVARYEGLRAALVLYVEQVDGFGIARGDAGIDPQLDLDRDLGLDPPPGFFAG